MTPTPTADVSAERDTDTALVEWFDQTDLCLSSIGPDGRRIYHQARLDRLGALARRATAPAPQRQDGYRAGMLRAAEIAQETGDKVRHPVPGGDEAASAYEAATAIRAETAAPEPPVVIDGTPSSGGAGDDAEFVEAARRVVARMRVTHDSYAGFEMVTIRKSAAERLIALAALYAAPPAPVPAGEVTVSSKARALVTAKRRFNRPLDMGDPQRDTHRAVGYIVPHEIAGMSEVIGLFDEIAAALTAAQPRADAGVTEALQWYAENVEGCRKLGSIGDPFRHALDADGGKRARAALAAREVR